MAYFKNDEDEHKIPKPKPGRLLPSAEEDSGSGFVGIDNGTAPAPQPQTQQPNAPQQMPMGTFSNAPSTTDAVSEAIKNGSLNGNPMMQQIVENQAKLIAMKTMPTYVNKRGEVVRGMQDKDGRLQSGLKGLVAGLAENFGNGGMARDWDDFGARMAGAVGRGVGGAIVPEWNEWADRKREIERLDTETKDMMSMQEWNMKVANQQSLINDRANDNKRQAETLRTRKRSDFYRRNKTFDPTKASEAQVKELADIGETPMSMGHYDFSKADLKWINGQAYQKDPGGSGAFVPSDLPKKADEALVEYSVKDPDTDVTTTYVVQQKKAAQLKNDLLRAGMQIDAAKERQMSQQDFSRSQQEDAQKHTEKIQLANQQMKPNDLLGRLNQYAKDNGTSLEEAKRAFKEAGVDVDGILKRQ